MTLYATGVRNAYDLLWHSNGNLYAPTNGSAPGGNTPAGGGAVGAVPTFHRSSPTGSSRFARTNTTAIPTPRAASIVLNGGNPTSGNDKYQVNAYPVGTKPDANWDPAIYSFGANRSPNGIIEYKSNTFGGQLKGSMLVVRYSGGDDVLILKPDASGNIPSSGVKTGITGLTGFVDPLDLAEHVGPGNLYVIEHGAQKITLLRPRGATTPPPAALTGLTLYNAVDDVPYGPLENFPTVSYTSLGTWGITVKAETTGTVGSVRWGFDGNANFSTENFAPYSVKGDINGTDLQPFPIPVGNHTITATVYSGPNGTGNALGTLTRTFNVVDTPNSQPPVPTGPVTGLTLYNAVDDVPVGPIGGFANGSTISYVQASTWGITIKAETSGAIGSIRWGVDGNANFRTESFAPYAIAGDNNGDLTPFVIAQGTHTMSVTVFSQADGQGTILQTLSLTFQVIDQP